MPQTRGKDCCSGAKNLLHCICFAHCTLMCFSFFCFYKDTASRANYCFSQYQISSVPLAHPLNGPFPGFFLTSGAFCCIGRVAFLHMCFLSPQQRERERERFCLKNMEPLVAYQELLPRLKKDNISICKLLRLYQLEQLESSEIPKDFRYYMCIAELLVFQQSPS